MGALRVQRIVGSVEGRRKGPTVVIVGGLHGNEPAGIHAAVRVLGHVAERRWALRGRVVVVSGNRAALAIGRRFVDRELDRRWSDDALTALAASPDRDASEDVEQLELARVFDHLAEEASGPVTVIDLHTSSAASPPFVCIADTLPSRAAALALGLPIVLGIDEHIDGALLGWLSDRGHAAIAVEGGRHDDAGAVERHVAALWLVLAAAGALHERDVPEFASHRERLEDSGEDLPRFVEVRHRHARSPDDGFVMSPGLRSFAPVAADAVVAHDTRGEVRAPEAGRLLMPLYQSQGDDGFFLARDVRPIWLRVSAALRRVGVERLVPLLPGLTRDREHPDQIATRPSWTPPHVVELMHLCGYRRVEETALPEGTGQGLVFSRSSRPPPAPPPDSQPPDRSTSARERSASSIDRASLRGK